jgi:type I restriction enzyme, S subunit
MSSWNEYFLGDLLQLQRGFDITKKEQQEGKVPIVSSSGITSFHNEAKAKAPGVITGRKGSLGKVHYLSEDYWPHDTTLWIKDFKGNNPRFLYYLLQLIHLENYDVGASNPTLNRNHVHKIKLKAPAPEIQEKIAAILSAYDDLIENNTKRIALLEKAAEEIYREWFVRMRFPGWEKTKFEKGIPVGWSLVPINKLTKFLGGFSFKSKDYVDFGTYGIVTIKNVHDGKFITKCSGHINEIPPSMKKHCHLKTGDILMSLTGNVGRVCIVYGQNLLLNQRVAKISPVSSNLTYYLYLTFRQKSFQQLTENVATGVAQQNLSPIKLGYQKILRPSDNLLQKFNDIYSPQQKLINSLYVANEKLQKSRDLLLSRLISGKLSVDELEIHFPPSMKTN